MASYCQSIYVVARTEISAETQNPSRLNKARDDDELCSVTSPLLVPSRTRPDARSHYSFVLDSRLVCLSAFKRSPGRSYLGNGKGLRSGTFSTLSNENWNRLS